MNDILEKRLLAFVWKEMLFESESIVTSDGDGVVIHHPGIPSGDENMPDFRDAQISIGDKCYVGSVAVHLSSREWITFQRNNNQNYDRVIINVVEENDTIIKRIDDSSVPTITINVSDRLRVKLANLIENSSKNHCPDFAHRNFAEIEISNNLTRLEIDRLERKYSDVMAIFYSCSENWHETFHIEMFKAMSRGVRGNKILFESLAKEVPYSKLCVEKGTLLNIEAMIFGVAGDLDDSIHGEYKEKLKTSFQELAPKHGLKARQFCQWENVNRPYNFPKVTLSKLSALIHENLLTFDNVMAARNIDDIYQLFRAKRTPFWRRNLDFNKRFAGQMSDRMSQEHIELMIINFVVPMMFSYGKHRQDEELKERAVDFMHQVEAESNGIVKRWSSRSVKIKNGFYSQAIIQLDKEYCKKCRCTECFIGTKVLKKR